MQFQYSPQIARSMFSKLPDTLSDPDGPPEPHLGDDDRLHQESYSPDQLTNPQTSIPKAPLIRTMIRGNNSVRYQCDIGDCTHTFGYPHGVKRHQLNSHGRLSGYKTVDASDVVIAKSKRTSSSREREQDVQDESPNESEGGASRSILQETQLSFNTEQPIKFPLLATPESSLPEASLPKLKQSSPSKFKDSAKFFCEFPGCEKIFPSNTIMRKHMKNTHKYRAMERGGPMLPPTQFENAYISGEDDADSDSDGLVHTLSYLPKPRSRGGKSRHDTLISKRGKPIVQCKLCNRTFAYENCLKRHMAFKHAKPGEERKARIVN